MKSPSLDVRALAALITGRGALRPLNGALAASAVDHGVGPILYRALVNRGEWARAEPAAAAVLSRAARQALVVEAVRHAHLQEAAGALARVGIAPLLFKGAAIAHTHYPEPWLRVRGDTDLLIHHDEVQAADGLLTSLGLERLPRPEGTHVTSQARYTMRWRSVEIAYDLHWRVADPQVFANALPYDVLGAAAQVGPVPGTRRVGNVHALQIACVHRAAHHFDTDHLLLLYDILLLAQGLTGAEWESFADEIRARDLRAVCRRGLDLAGELFGLRIPDSGAAALEPCGSEASAAFVTRPMTRLAVLRSDLRSLPGWRDRISLLREHAFPHARYMRLAAGDNATPVPVMYITRLLRGLNAWRQPL